MGYTSPRVAMRGISLCLLSRLFSYHGNLPGTAAMTPPPGTHKGPSTAPPCPVPLPVAWSPPPLLRPPRHRLGGPPKCSGTGWRLGGVGPLWVPGDGAGRSHTQHLSHVLAQSGSDVGAFQGIGNGGG